jgi:hypothetical protein
VSRIIAVVLCVLLLVGCGAAMQTATSDGPGTPTEFTYTTKDDITVTCVQVYYRGLGLSCDWHHAS